ncbi:type IV pilin [Halorubellus sp. JP-L1]|uniref:DUF7289 family protein n=1 Tax=Halorubellus sp. JP-L1 TaxID=2715753 RepID=UPI00140C9744|nr:type IV pilin [Halorubellus sp. JP-L1]NHN42222.1 type IV pilin [Halorubellus sp. JP-L1]
MTREDAPGVPVRDSAQSHVVGVALLLGVTVVAMAAVTAGVGSTVDSGVARADADRAADAFADVDAVSRTGPGTERVAFADGHLSTVERDVRVLDGDGDVVRRVRSDALVFEAGDRRVAYLAGAVVRGNAGNAWLVEDPPIAVGEDDLLVGAPALGPDASSGARGEYAVGGRGRASLAVDVEHDRETLPADAYRLAVETTTPGPWRRYFESLGATVDTRDVDGDGVESVVASFPGSRRLHLVVHALDLEVAP